MVVHSKGICSRVIIILLVLNFIFSIKGVNIDSLLITKQVATVQLLPLTIGLVIKKISKDLGEEIGNLLLNAANTLFIVVLVFILSISFNIIPLAGWQTFSAIAIIVSLGLIAGHLLGGTENNYNTRPTLATATIARNIGLALFVAIVNGATNAVGVIITYAVLGAVFAFPYNVWIKRQATV